MVEYGPDGKAVRNKRDRLAAVASAGAVGTQVAVVVRRICLRWRRHMVRMTANAMSNTPVATAKPCVDNEWVRGPTRGNEIGILKAYNDNRLKLRRISPEQPAEEVVASRSRRGRVHIHLRIVGCPVFALYRVDVSGVRADRGVVRVFDRWPRLPREKDVGRAIALVTGYFAREEIIELVLARGVFARCCCGTVRNSGIERER
jgi:hypothetical protein